jgi:hypothetical protein
MKRPMLIAVLATGTALTLGMVAWTQVRNDAGTATGPVPTAVLLTPTREQAAARDAALKDPVTDRLRRGMTQDPRTRTMLAQINVSTVPVLGPIDPALMTTAIFVSGDRHYMLVVERDGQVIEIYGTTRAFQSSAPATTRPAPPATSAPTSARRRSVVPTAALRQARAAGMSDIHIEPTEYGTDVAFSRFGAAYNVSFICEGPGSPGCTPAEALAFAAELRLIGGGGQ